jgi:citrate lyase subunit beta/citryl-CoA lyase
MSAALSYLFVPGNRPERFDKALAAGADRVILDLEDAVAPADKPSARTSLCQWIAALQDAQRPRVLVRINDAQSPWFEDDLAALSPLGLAAVMLPKSESVLQLARVRQALGADCALLPLIESAKGLVAVHDLAGTPGVERLAFGALDYQLDLDLPGDGFATDFAATTIVLACRNANIDAPIAGVTPAIDPERVRHDMLHARSLGFGAKMCIHPSQVAAVHTALQPSAESLAWAQRVLDAWHGGAGTGSISVDGKMVDKPVFLRAQRIVDAAR